MSVRQTQYGERIEAEIIAMKPHQEWAAIDMRFIAELTGVLARLYDEEMLLGQEGSVVAGRNGPKVNPRFHLTRELLARAGRLCRYLRIDPIAGDRRDPSLVRAGRIAERQAREALKNREDNAFLA